MALRRFWHSVRFGAGDLTPRAIVDSKRLDAQTIERSLRSATLWLSPDVVSDFDVADFDFLPDEDQTKLAKLVQDFKRVASEVDPVKPATDAQIQKALPLFRDLVEFMEFDRYGDPDAFRLGKRIERGLEPYRLSEIAELRFNTGLDHTGDPGIWIWTFLTDDASKTDEEFLSHARKIRTILDSVARKVTRKRWPYISFRSIGEQAEIVGAL